MGTTRKEVSTEILIVGGGLGGVSAALAATRLGRKVVLVEELDWLGGQLTAQGVPLDEHPWAESLVSSQSFAALRGGIRAFYRDHMPLTADARRDFLLNPGIGNVGTLCCEPVVALRVIEAMLAPYVGAGLLTVLRRNRVTACAVNGDEIAGVEAIDLETGTMLSISASIVIDATETGELLPLAKIEHVLGAELRDQTGELHAIDGPADPLDQQSLTWGFALDYLPGEDHTIDKPEGYAHFRNLKLPFWPGPQFGWTVSNHVTHQPLDRKLFVGGTDEPYLFDLWHARRIAARRNFLPGAYPSDITIANWPQMDYWLKPAVGVPEAAARAALDEARRFSLSFFHWLQTEAPRHDGGNGYPGLRLRGDVLGTKTASPSKPISAKATASAPSSRCLSSISASRLAPVSTAPSISRTASASAPTASTCIPRPRAHATPSTSIPIRSRSRSAPCCRFASIICCPPARTWHHRASPTAPIACIPWNGALGKQAGRSPPMR